MALLITRLGHIQRKDYLEEYYGVHLNKEIALACGVHLSTINKDIAEWKASGEYDEWLDHRWHYYLESDTVDDRTKFLALTRLKEKRIAKISLSKIEHRGKIGIDINALLKTYEELFTENPVPKDHPGEQVHTAHADGGPS